MARLLLIVCAILACGLVSAHAQTSLPNSTVTSATPADIQPPPARLIKPKTQRGDTRPAERTRRPLDERCKPLKDQLDLALQKPGNQHRLFQARLAHNAGARLCREGHADKGIAELQRGLSYLQETPH